MKTKPRWMQSVIAAARKESETPLFVGRRKRDARRSANVRPVHA